MANLATKLIEAHLIDGQMTPGSEIALRIDQTLTQDATGTLVMLELEAMGIERVATEVSAQYVDHNLIAVDHKNPDDHLFLRSACQRFGVWYSPPGNGVSHPVHMERFGRPGATLLGADSHTPAAGALGMLAIGAGGIEVALAMAGRPFYMTMPEIWGVELVGRLPTCVSAKDVILELLRRHGVSGGRGRIIEYRGSGLDALTAMDRHVIANMGAELGATSSVFPSDGEVAQFLAAQGRSEDWTELMADDDASYEVEERIDLSSLEPLIALPSSPGNVVPVAEVAGREIAQAYIGSSANPGYRDFAVAAEIVRGQRIHDRVSFDINPSSRQVLEALIRDGHLAALVAAGARIHQVGCNGCIGMGQAPATEVASLRTVPRNFPGRSGTREDQVYLVSPETAAASALRGVITDPRTLERGCPTVASAPKLPIVNEGMVVAPPSAESASKPESGSKSPVELRKGPNIVSLPELDALPERLELTIAAGLGDDVSTDEILPAGARVLPFRSNVPKISEFVFADLRPDYVERTRELGSHALVAGSNYGQGSSREHAALGPRFLGLRLVLAESFSRIHRKNLISYGVLPLTFADPETRASLEVGDVVSVEAIAEQLRAGDEVEVHDQTRGSSFATHHGLSPREIDILAAGGAINWVREQGGPSAAGR